MKKAVAIRWLVFILVIVIIYTTAKFHTVRNLYIRAFTNEKVEEEPAKETEHILLVGTQPFAGVGIATKTPDILSIVLTVFANLAQPHDNNVYYVWITNSKYGQYFSLGPMQKSGLGFTFSAYVDEAISNDHQEVLISEESRERTEFEFPQKIKLFGTFEKN